MEPKVSEKFFSEYPTLTAALEQVGRLSDRDYKLLLSSIRGPNTFERSPQRCRALAADLDSTLSPKEVSMILGGLAFIYDRLALGDGTDDKPFADFVEFSGLGEIWQKNELDVEYLRVAELVRRNPEIDRTRQNRWLATGVADLAVDFDGFVDLRPRFSTDFSIEELVPVIMFRVAVETDVGSSKSYVFQINMAGMKELKDVLNDIQSQIESVKKDSVFGPKIVTDDED